MDERKGRRGWRGKGDKGRERKGEGEEGVREENDQITVHYESMYMLVVNRMKSHDRSWRTIASYKRSNT